MNDDSTLDAALASLTHAGEDRGFRAEVLRRIANSPHARPAFAGAVAGRRLAFAAIVAMLLAGSWLAWRAVGPTVQKSPVNAEVSVPEPTSARAEPHPQAPTSTGSRPDTAPSPSAKGRRMRRASSTQKPTETPAAVEVASASADGPLPFGIERVRIEAVAIELVSVAQVGDDPALAALASPQPVVVEPVHIDELVPGT